MAQLKAQTLRQETAEKLRSLLEEKRRALRTARVLALVGKLKDVNEIAKVRKEVARIATVLKEKSLL